MKNKYSLIINIFIGLGMSLLFASGLLFLKVGDVESAGTGTIKLEAVPSTIDLRNDSTKYTDIQYSFAENNGESYHLWITDCAGNYQDKKTGVVAGNVDPAPPATHYSEPWTPEETTCASHQVRIKTFDSAGQPTGLTAEITVTVNGIGGGGTTPPGTTPGTEPTDGGAINLHLSDLNSITLKNFMPGKGCNENLEGIVCILEGVINIILDLAGIVAFIMILYASIIYLTSYGEESRAELAKKTLIWSVIGVIVIVLSKAILFMIQNLILKKGI